MSLRVSSMLVLVALAAACVPASEPRPPAGAAGYVLSPTSATQGEPFIRDWSIVCEKLVLRMSINASRPYDYNGRSGRSYASEQYLFDARVPQELFAGGMSPGSASLTATLQGQYISSRGNEGERATVIGVGEDDLARMHRTADGSTTTYYTSGSYTYSYGPSILVRLRGTRGDDSVVVDASIDSSAGVAGIPTANVDVRENEFAAVRLTLGVENLFDDALTFDMLVAADANGDQTVTAKEMLAVSMSSKPAPPPGSIGYYQDNTLLHVFVRQISQKLLRLE